MLREPVRILGAGIAGLTAAICLARQGVKVKVIEKKKSIGSKFGFHINALRLYEESDFLQELEQLGVQLSPSGKITRMIKKSPSVLRCIEGDLYLVFERGDGRESIEMQLFRTAVKEGVEFEFGRFATADEADIIATGAPMDRFNMLGVGYIFELDGSNLRPEEVILVYDHHIAPAGYLCFLPSRDRFMLLSVSFTLLQPRALFARLDAALGGDEFFKETVGRARLLQKVTGMGYYAEDPIAQAMQDGKLYIGEAAGFQDARRGFGIRYAVISGILAAESVLRNRDFRILLADAFGREFDRLNEKRKWINASCCNEYFDRWMMKLPVKSSINEYLCWKNMETFVQANQKSF